MKAVLESLEIGMDIEKEGIRFYSDAANSVKDPNGKSTLKFLANEEKRHLEFLEDLKTSFTKADKSKISEVMGAYASTLERPKIFPDKKEYKRKIRSSKEDEKILSEAKGVEERSIKFYKKCSEKVNSEEYKGIFNILIREEKKHLEWIEFMEDALNVHGYWSGMEDYFSLGG